MNPSDIAQLLDNEFHSHCEALETDHPWFGHMTLDVEKKSYNYKISGKKLTEISEEARLNIISFEHLLAIAYYEGDVGEEVEIESKAPVFVNKVTLLNHRAKVLNADGRRIQTIEINLPGGDHYLSAKNNGFSHGVTKGEVNVAPPEQTGLPDITPVLSKEQFRLITSRMDKPLVVQGGAGSGKTTVGLYRVAYLTRPKEDRGLPAIDPKNVLIVMFNKALSSYIQETLSSLEIDITPTTFDAWALKMSNQVCRGGVSINMREDRGNDKINDATLKKDERMLSALKQFASDQEGRLVAWMDKKLEPVPEGREIVKRFQGMAGPVVQKLIRLKNEIRKACNVTEGKEQKVNEQIFILLEKALTRMTLYRDDLYMFFTDTSLLSTHLNAGEKRLKKLSDFQTFLQKRDDPDGPVGASMTFEDLPLLLHLVQLKHGGLAAADEEEQLEFADHLMVDEVQDFSTIQLKVLLNTVKEKCNVTVVGDINQKIFPYNNFMGWDALIRDLGIDGSETTHLEVGHRSTAQIMKVAATIQELPSIDGRQGEKPVLVTVPDDDNITEQLASLIEERVFEKPNAHICVVTSTTKEAQKVLDRLSHHIIHKEDCRLNTAQLRLGHNKKFEFGAGVTITNLHQVKGLEFDTVILLNPTSNNYKDNKTGRRQLYTVITRAQERLAFILGGDELSPLLQRAFDQGLIEDKMAEENITEIVFDDDDEGAI